MDKNNLELPEMPNYEEMIKEIKKEENRIEFMFDFFYILARLGIKLLLILIAIIIVVVLLN